ncbi:MAG: hypothetical protein M1817_000121 [Caeruleum heppii]|nr:MAG: hypothetical protein M1817_000121 [Caeruleum heppii]
MSSFHPPRRRPLARLLHILLHLSLLCSPTLSYSALSNSTLDHLPRPDASTFDITTGTILAPLLQPRVPGTPEHDLVLDHLVSFFHDHLPAWSISFENSTSKTPHHGDREIPFTNLIVRREPPWAKEGEVNYLTLVAHYDSKLTPEGFVGATDSAAPCAMLMFAAQGVDGALTRKWEAMGKDGHVEEEDLEGVGDEGVQLIFLDGEEAFVSWTNTDSLYGARSLAETWESTPHPALSTHPNSLSSISLFVLLDLLGAASPTIPSYFLTTHWAYQHLAALETRLRELGHFHSSPNHPSKRTNPTSPHPNRNEDTDEPLFLPDSARYTPDPTSSSHHAFPAFLIQDDHIPFLHRGVSVLHLIPSPFPTVWHEMSDDGAHLDGDTVADWAVLMLGFVGEWMGVEGFFEGGSSSKEGRTEDGRGGKRGVVEEREIKEEEGDDDDDDDIRGWRLRRKAWGERSKTEL